MSQKTITSFFNSRKRPASDDINGSKNKIPHLERSTDVYINPVRGVQLTRKKSEAEKLGILVFNGPSVPVNVKKETQSTHLTPSREKLKVPLAEPCTVGVFNKKTNATNIAKQQDVAKPKTEVIEVSSARKELSLGDIRKKLAGSSRLAELRARAEKLSKGIQDLKQASQQGKIKEFKSIDVEVPISPSKRATSQKELLSPVKQVSVTCNQEKPFISPRKVFVSPIKSPSKVPAYIRHASLATSATSLPLPHHYRFLAELFRGMETVVGLLYNRNEKITFNKLKPSIQEMLKRNFTEKHLAQIKHAVPDFYTFEVQKIKSFSTTCQKESYELIIVPNFPNDMKTMTPSVLLERRRYFYDTLLQMVKKHHTQYLLTLDPPMVISEDKLTRWHPEFELEKIPEVECSKLPELPSVEKLSSAQDVLSKARELFKCNTKMERALDKLAQAKARGLTEQEKIVTGIIDKPVTSNNVSTQAGPSTTANVTILNPALRNLPASLLERVKAKQAAKALEAMTRSTESEHKYIIYSRLPDLSKTLRNIFVTERKNVLALNIILSKLDSSFKANVSASDLQRDIKLLANEAPEFVSESVVRNTTYIKLDKNVELKKLTTKLEALAQKFKGD